MFVCAVLFSCLSAFVCRLPCHLESGLPAAYRAVLLTENECKSIFSHFSLPEHCAVPCACDPRFEFPTLLAKATSPITKKGRALGTGNAGDIQRESTAIQSGGSPLVAARVRPPARRCARTGSP